MAADIAETITEIVPHMGLKLVYFTGTKVAADDYMTFSDYTQVLWANAMSGTIGSAAVVDTITAITTNVVTFSVGTSTTVRGIALVI